MIKCLGCHQPATVFYNMSNLLSQHRLWALCTTHADELSQYHWPERTDLTESEYLTLKLKIAL